MVASQSDDTQATWRPAPGLVPTVYQVTRALKKEHNSLFNCLCSCIDDAAFVEEICCLYPGLPCLANLRCGRWYVRHPDDTCYFKSTDGHMGAWGFSLVRLNMHVAHLAATRGGVIIVDATRNAHKGGFPDALAKTIPIWAAVLNTAVKQLRDQQQPPATATSPSRLITREAEASSCADQQAGSLIAATNHDRTGASRAQHSSGTTAGDQDGHALDHSRLTDTADADTPPSVGIPPESTCADDVRSHRAPSSDSDSTPAGDPWDTAVHFPVWISRNEVQQVQARVPQWVETLMTTSPQSVAGLAQVLHKPLRPLWISQNSTIWVDQVAQPDDLPFHPLILVTASQAQCRGERRPDPLSRHRAAHQAAERGDAGISTAGQQDEGTHVASDTMQFYSYLPGAGDDEESWGVGLTPEMLWSHQEELLAGGPTEVYQMAAELVRKHKNPAAAAQLLAAGQVPSLRLPAPTDEYHLAPQGCRAPQAAQTQPLGHGVFAITGSLLALGGWAAGNAPAVWQVVDAVLYLGTAPHTGMTEQDSNTCQTSAQLPQTDTPQAAKASARPQTVPPVATTHHPHDTPAGCSQHHTQSVVTTTTPAPCPQEGLLQTGTAVQPHTAHPALQPHPLQVGFDHQTVAATCNTATSVRQSGSSRYLWLPTSPEKHAPNRLSVVLAQAVPWVLSHTRAGHRVLIHDDTGVDLCVSTAVAVLLSDKCDLSHVTKEQLRAMLSEVAACYPQARPTRTMLQQVFAYCRPPDRRD